MAETKAVQGGLQQLWVKAQTTYKTLVTMASTDSVLPIKGSVKIDPEYAHEESKEANGTPSLVDEIPQGKGGKWGCQFHLAPNAAGTAPDIGELIRAAMGTETVVGSTSVTYAFSDTARVPLQLLQHVASATQKTASGAVVEEMTIEGSGKAAPTVSFSGSFAAHGWAHADEVGVGGIAYGETTLPIDDDSRGSFGTDARIQFANDDGGTAGAVTTPAAETWNLDLGLAAKTLTIKVDAGSTQTVTMEEGDFVDDAAATAAEVAALINSDTTGCTAYVTNDDKVSIVSDKVGSGSSIQVTGGTANAILGFSTDAVAGTAGSGYLITAVDNTEGAAELTISPGIVSRAGHSAGDAITPWAPTHSTTGARISGGLSELEIDGVGFGAISYKISVSPGLSLRSDEATVIDASGIKGGDRRVKVEISCYMFANNAGNAAIHGSGWSDITHEIDLRIGPDTAAQRSKINIPKIRFEVNSFDIPESEEVVINLTGTARMDSTSGDEMTWVWD